MKIFRSDPALTEEVAPHSGQNKGQAGVAGSGLGVASESFINIVEEMETRRLLDELNVLGSQLSRFPTMTLLAQYRSLVRQLLDRARQNMQNRREFKWRRTERAMFIFIEKTEGALSELEDGLIREGERTRLLMLMEEIKGCLISLLF